MASLFHAAPPDVAVAIDESRVVAARMGRGDGNATHAIEALPPGLVVPSLASSNITDVGAVGQTITQALSRLGGRPTRVALVVPDAVAKVSLVRFDNVPERAADLLEMVRWQVRKTAPFPLEQAVVSYTVGARGTSADGPAATPSGAQEFVVSMARRDIIAEYEAACDAAGVHAGLVDIATFCLINGVLAGSVAPTGDWLVVHAAPSSTTIAVMRGSDLIFFRRREEEHEGSVADVVHQTTMYYEDRLKGSGFSRVLLAGGAAQSGDAARRSLEDRLDTRIEAIADPTLAPLFGILRREQQAA